MDKQKRLDLEKILYDWVKRVAEGKTTSETEITVLPEVVKLLLEH